MIWKQLESDINVIIYNLEVQEKMVFMLDSQFWFTLSSFTFSFMIFFINKITNTFYFKHNKRA